VIVGKDSCFTPKMKKPSLKRPGRAGMNPAFDVYYSAEVVKNEP
jgi:hypothetical protein